MRTKKKNTMRSSEEKEAIVLESYRDGRDKIANKYDISKRLLAKWREKYRKCGIDGLHRQTGNTIMSDLCTVLNTKPHISLNLTWGIELFSNCLLFVD